MKRFWWSTSMRVIASILATLAISATTVARAQYDASLDQAPGSASIVISLAQGANGLAMGNASANHVGADTNGPNTVQFDGRDPNDPLGAWFDIAGSSDADVNSSSEVTAIASIYATWVITGPAKADPYIVTVRLSCHSTASAGAETHVTGQTAEAQSDPSNGGSSSAYASGVKGYDTHTTDQYGSDLYEQVTIGTDGIGRLTVPFSQQTHTKATGETGQFSIQDCGSSVELVYKVRPTQIIGPDGTTDLPPPPGW